MRLSVKACWQQPFNNRKNTKKYYRRSLDVSWYPVTRVRGWRFRHPKLPLPQMEQLNIARRRFRGSRFAAVSPMSRSRCSQFFPVGQRHQLVENFLQSLEPTFVIPRFARYLLLAALGVLAVRFTDLRYFFSQFHDAVFNGILHEDRLAERKAPESIQIWS